jgi:hypothetical protein
MPYLRTPFVVLTLLCCVFLTQNALAQAPSATGAVDLTRPQDYVLRHVSSYDRSGGNADYRKIAPGQTLTVLDVDGPATLTHIWQFLPIFARRWRKLSPGGLQAWKAGFGTRALWRMDRPTPMEAVRTLDPTPSAAAVAETLRRARQLIPELRDSAVGTSWAGFVDSTPDGVPVIDGALAISGLLLAAGFSGHGFGIGPGAGRLAADIVLGRRPNVPLEQFRLSRFRQAAWGKVSEF